MKQVDTARIAWAWAVKFEPRDMWVGLFWDHERKTYGGHTLSLYLCALPMVPLVVRIDW